MNVNVVLAQWRTVPTAARAVLGFAVAVIIGVSIFAGVVSQRPRVALFASPLHTEQLAEVEERLAGWSEPFTPAADNVIIDASRRNALLLRLSLSGVPHPHVADSSERLATIGALTPQTVIDAQTRAGLAGDIELGLRGIDGVDDAQVIVAPAKPAEFADESSREASASVRLRLRGDSHLAPGAIEGIRNFVAASVPGLDAARVTIVDDRGVALTASNDASDDQSALQLSLQSALDQAFGAGTSIVRVRTERDQRAQETHDVRQAPLGTLTLTGSDESYSGQGKNYQHRERSEEHGSETRESTMSLPGGAIARLSVAVFVDAARGSDLAKIRALSAATVGFDERRGDELIVQAVNFAQETPQRTDAWWLAYGAIVPLLPTLCIVIAILFGLRWLVPSVGSALRSLAEHASIAQTKQAVQGFAPSRVASVLRDEPPHAAAAVISALPAATAAAVLDMFPPHERSAIVRRMQRPHSPLIPNAEEIIDRA
jgi:flagellar M-ring protein FliF